MVVEGMSVFNVSVTIDYVCAHNIIRHISTDGLPTQSNGSLKTVKLLHQEATLKARPLNEKYKHLQMMKAKISPLLD